MMSITGNLPSSRTLLMRKISCLLLMTLAVCSPWVAAPDAIDAEAMGAQTAFCGEPTLPVGEPPPAFKIRLGKDRQATHPRGKLRVRVENLGTETVRYGNSYRLQRYKHGSWIDEPVGPFFTNIIYAQGGTAGPCQEIRMARNATAGTYRLSKQVKPAASQGGKSIIVRTTFRVR
jgi:hypothetical protein